MDISPETYLEHCKRRFGDANPERIANPIWEWMVRERHNPYVARKALGLETDFGGCMIARNPDWCFQRMGMPVVKMHDGREISIAGEHEDSYDPDFCIYNDVIVRKGDNVAIYGYPREVFPPTDFHTATLINNDIWLIGSLGYSEERGGAMPQVCLLDTRTYEIRRVSTSGESPGWISHHKTVLLKDGVTVEVCGGEVLRNGGETEKGRTNFDTFHLHTETRVWKKMSNTSVWRQFRIMYDEDITRRMELIELWMRWHTGEVLNELGYPVDPAPDSNETPEHHVHTVHVDGVPVRIEDSWREVRVVIEGVLPEATVQSLLTRLQSILVSIKRTVEEVVED